MSKYSVQTYFIARRKIVEVNPSVGFALVKVFSDASIVYKPIPIEHKQKVHLTQITMTFQ